jgi:hypothetical protein
MPLRVAAARFPLTHPQQIVQVGGTETVLAESNARGQARRRHRYAGGLRPDLLITGSLHDPRALTHEPAKWVARLLATGTAGSRVLFRPELGAGSHTGPGRPVRPAGL